MRIDQKPPTLFANKVSAISIATSLNMEENIDGDGWAYKVIEHGEYYWEIAAYDNDGTYLGSF